MLVLEFIGTKGDKGWMKFMMNEVIHKNKLIQILGKRPTIIEAASVGREEYLEDFGEEERDNISIQYEMDANPKTNRETNVCVPLVKIYTTLPGVLIDSVRSLVKSGETVTDAASKALMSYSAKKLSSDKKIRELTVIATIFNMEPDGFKYLVVKS